MRRTATAVGVSLLVLSSRRGAAAEPPVGQGPNAPPITVKLEWTAASADQSCISAGDVERAVEAMVQRHVFVQEATPDIAIRISLACHEGAFVASLAMKGADGRELGARRLEGDGSGSEPLFEAVALVIAVAIDSLQAEPLTLRVPSRDDGLMWRGRIAPTAALSLGRFPSPSLGYGLGAAVQPPGFWAINLSLVEWTATRVDKGGKGAEFGGWQASISACPTVLSRGPWAGSACVGAEGARLRASGFGLDNQHDVYSWVPSLVGQLLVSAAATRHIALDAMAGLGLPFVRDRFVYHAADGQTFLVHRPYPVSGQVGIALAVTIP